MIFTGKDLEQKREYRAKDFDVKVEKLNKRDQWLYDDELSIQTTHNGRQWTNITVTPEEANRLMAKLSEYLSKAKK